MTYYLVRCTAQTGFDIAPAARQALLNRVICDYCCAIRRQRVAPAPIDVTLLNAPTEPISLGRLFRAAVPIYHVSLLDALGLDARGFIVGRCLEGGARLIAEYVTCYSPSEVVLYSQEPGLMKVCPRCESTWPDVRWIRTGGEVFLRGRELANRSACQDSSGRLFIDSALAQQVDWMRYPDTKLIPIEVLSGESAPRTA